MYILEAVWFFTYPVFLVAGMRGGFKGTAKLTAGEWAVIYGTFQTFVVIQLCLVLIGPLRIDARGW